MPQKLDKSVLVAMVFAQIKEKVGTQAGAVRAVWEQLRPGLRTAIYREYGHEMFGVWMHDAMLRKRHQSGKPYLEAVAQQALAEGATVDGAKAAVEGAASALGFARPDERAEEVTRDVLASPIDVGQRAVPLGQATADDFDAAADLLEKQASELCGRAELYRTIARRLRSTGVPCLGEMVQPLALPGVAS